MRGTTPARASEPNNYCNWKPPSRASLHSFYFAREHTRRACIIKKQEELNKSMSSEAAAPPRRPQRTPVSSVCIEQSSIYPGKMKEHALERERLLLTDATLEKLLAGANKTRKFTFPHLQMCNLSPAVTHSHTRLYPFVCDF